MERCDLARLGRMDQPFSRHCSISGQADERLCFNDRWMPGHLAAQDAIRYFGFAARKGPIAAQAGVRLTIHIRRP
jgi:hypothetical protein